MCPANIRNAGPVVAPPAAPPRPAAGPAAPTSAPGAAHPADTFAPSAAPARVFPGGPRRWGSWAWSTGALANPAALEALLASHRAAGATELYLNAYPLLGRERVLRDAVAKAQAAGLSPQLLLGSPEWTQAGLRPWLAASILEPLRAVRAAVPASALERLPVHLDVEPHAAGPLTLEKMRDYLDVLSWLGAQLGPGFTLQVDIPAWYRGQQVDGRDFAEEILRRVDGVTLMAYARAAPQVLADVAPTLALAARLGKQALVAVEVGPQHAAVGLATPADVRRFLAQLDTALAGTPGYGGCAVHGLEASRPPVP